jgi:biopolymer transport protein ExbD
MSSPLRRRGAMHEWHAHFGPNMTPMVDVVMVILIFFMASTALVGPEWILRAQVAPKPREGAGGFALGPAELIVALEPSPDGPLVSGLGLERAPLALLADAAQAAATTLAQSIEHTQIIIEPDDRVGYAAVVQVQEALVHAGFRAVALR